jgi:hypothetical protein
VAEAGQRPSAVIHYSVLPPLLFLLRPPAFPPSPFLLYSPPFLLKTPQASNRCTDWLSRLFSLPRLNRHWDPAPPRQAPGPTPPRQASGPYSASACTLERPGQWILAAAGGVSHRFVAPAIAKLDSRWVRFSFRCVQMVPPSSGPTCWARDTWPLRRWSSQLASLPQFAGPYSSPGEHSFPLFGSRLDRLWERSSP